MGELELSPEQMYRIVEVAMARITTHIASLAEQPASYDTDPGSIAGGLAEALPSQGEPLEELLDTLFERALPHSFNTAGPGYMAYVPGGGIFPAAVADLIANSINRYTGVWLAAPGLAQLEMNVIRWFCEMIGYPAEALGFLAPGGSPANLSAVVTARCERLPADFLRGTLYVSDQGHHSLHKAARLAGFPAENLRIIPSDDCFRIRLDALADRVTADRQAGFTPFFVMGNAGTTNTGAVDDLPGLAALARQKDLWLHLDAAYGGFFVLTERGQLTLAGIELADSITLDPHKGLFLPFGTGCLLVRDGQALRRTHSATGDYMPPMQQDPDRVDFCEISPELTKDYRGLRVWLPLKLHGLAPFRQCLDEKLDLAAHALAALREIEGVEIVAEPQLSALAFRLVQPNTDLNRLNERLLVRINLRQQVLLNGTLLDGRFVIRICVLCFRTHRDRVDACIEDIREAIAEI